MLVKIRLRLGANLIPWDYERIAPKIISENIFNGGVTNIQTQLIVILDGKHVVFHIEQ